jgi:steroid 5-alpha reductase family enzyme
MLSIDTWFWRYKDPNYIMEQCFFWELLFIVKVAIIHRYRKNDNHNMEDLTKYGYKS